MHGSIYVSGYVQECSLLGAHSITPHKDVFIKNSNHIFMTTLIPILKTIA